MKHKVIVILAVALLCVTAWAVPDPYAQDQIRIATPRPAAALSADGEGAAPTRVVRDAGDTPAGYQALPPPAPTVGEPPQLVRPIDGGEPAGSPPLWGPDVTVYGDTIRHCTPAGSERMIAYDQSQDGTLYAAFVVPSGDTAWVYRSTDQGSTWAKWNGIYGPSSVWSSLKLVVAEGDSDFVFFFARRSTGNGDIYVGRWDFGTTMADLFSVKVDADTIVNFSACRDKGNPYFLHVAYETREGNYSMRQLRSTDYGKTWAATGGYVLNDGTSPKPDVCFGNGDNVYIVLRHRASSTDSVQLRCKQSTNRGDSWLGSQQISNLSAPVYDPVIGANHTDSTVWVVHTRDLDSISGTGDAVCYYYSTDNGASWTNGSFLGPNTDADEQMPSIACRNTTGAATVCYAQSPGDSLWFTWASSATGWSTPVMVNDHEYTGWFAPQAGWNNNYSSVLYSGMGAIGLYFDAFYMTGMEQGRPVVQKPATVTARPSPARDRAAINYSLPKAGSARVSVSDVAGRQVAVLTQGTLAAGEHGAVWNCGAVPAGVYLVRIETSTGSQTGRVVVSH
jgi:hypothetical protein